jgi:peptidoglycan hydrolase-like protein with peptidoglycan-binding domain
MVANTSPYDQNVNVILLPINSSGTSLLGIARTVNFTILASGVAVPSSNTTSVPTVTTPATQQLLTGTPHMPFTQYLVRSSRKSDVKGVQQFLAQSLAIYPEGSVTGYYGPATERAVGRFQEKYLLAKKGGEGYGSVGPKTRAKMNTLNVP